MRPFHTGRKLLRSVVTPWRSAYTLNISMCRLQRSTVREANQVALRDLCDQRPIHIGGQVRHLNALTTQSRDVSAGSDQSKNASRPARGPIRSARPNGYMRTYECPSVLNDHK